MESPGQISGRRTGRWPSRPAHKTLPWAGPRQRVDVTLLRAAFASQSRRHHPRRATTVRHHYRSPAVYLDERLHVLQEVELLVGCCGPEVLAGIGDGLQAAGLRSIEDADAALLPKGGLVMTRS